jgi:hypothetical protein
MPVACGLYYESFTIIIYDRNDIGQYYKTINYHSSVVNKWRHNLERTLLS